MQNTLKPITRAQCRAVEKQLAHKDELDREVLKLTAWDNPFDPTSSPETLGDLIGLAVAGHGLVRHARVAGEYVRKLDSWEWTVKRTLTGLAQEIEVMAQAELSKRSRRGHRGHYSESDLYGPLTNLHGRLLFMAETLPRLMKANPGERDMREKIADGAPIDQVVALVMRTPAGYVGAAGSRDGLLGQIQAMDPKVARELRSELHPRPGYVPVIALDPIDRTHGIEWIGPFPNAPGGQT